MSPWLFLWSVVCLGGVALSVRSVAVLRSRSPWTIAGWCFTALYFAVAGIDALRAKPAAAHLDYVALALLALTFVIAGLRDEPQAEPWWWPTVAGLTGRERREKRERS